MITVAGRHRMPLLVLAVIGTVAAGPGTLAKPVELLFASGGDKAELDIRQAQIRIFERKFPNIRVKMVTLPHPRDEKLFSMIAAGLPPDVFYLNEYNYAHFASKGVLKDLTPLIKGDTSFRKESFYPELWSHMTYNGRMYAIPQEVSPILLYYNVASFGNAGLNPPDGTWDWDTFANQCLKLSGNGKYSMFLPGNWWGSITPWCYQNNAVLLNEKTRKSTFNNPEALKALKFLLELRERKAFPDAATQSKMDFMGVFHSGKVAMIDGGAWHIPALRSSKAKLDWDVVTFPKGKRMVTTAATLNYGISGNTKRTKEAWEFIKFLTGPEGQAVIARMGMALPSIDDPDVVRQFTHPSLPPKSASMFAVAARNLDLGMFRFKEFPLIADVWSEGIGRTWSGKRSLEDTLRFIDERINKTILKK